MAGHALAAGLSLWSSLVPLSRGLALDHFSLIEHEVQAVADELDDCKEDGHRAAVEQRSEDVWRESLQRGEGKDAHACRLLPCFKPHAVQLFTEQKSGKISSAWGFSPVRISKAKELYYLFTFVPFCFPDSNQ